jgi:hypothetical protein
VTAFARVRALDRRLCVAYQKLFAVAWVALGLSVAACGAGEGASAAAAPDDSDSPPASEDQPPGNPDRPPFSSDQPPSNPDRPPNNDSQPSGGGSVVGGGGGDLLSLCFTVCQVSEDCDTQAGDRLRKLCNTGCRVAEGQAEVPCGGELAGLLGCIGSVGMCPSDAEGFAILQQCGAASQAYDSCEEAREPQDGDPPLQNCTLEGGCENCGSACLTCTCEAGTDEDAILACGDDCMP